MGITKKLNFTQLGNETAVKVFIESRVNIDQKNSFGWRALDIAVLNGNLE